MDRMDSDKNTFEKSIDDTATGIDAITTLTTIASNVCNEVTIAPTETPDDGTDCESVGTDPNKGCTEYYEQFC